MSLAPGLPHHIVGTGRVESADRSSGSRHLHSDLEPDGHIDVAVANRGGQPNFVYLNDGSGRFDRPIPFGTGDDESMQVAADGLNGNGYIDLVTAAPD